MRKAAGKIHDVAAFHRPREGDLCVLFVVRFWGIWLIFSELLAFVGKNDRDVLVDRPMLGSVNLQNEDVAVINVKRHGLLPRGSRVDVAEDKRKLLLERAANVENRGGQTIGLVDDNGNLVSEGEEGGAQIRDGAARVRRLVEEEHGRGIELHGVRPEKFEVGESEVAIETIRHARMERFLEKVVFEKFFFGSECGKKTKFEKGWR